MTEEQPPKPKYRAIQDTAIIIIVILMALVVWKLWTNIDVMQQTPCEACEELGYSCNAASEWYTNIIKSQIEYEEKTEKEKGETYEIEIEESGFADAVRGLRNETPLSH